jgi:hypothetical protein
VGAASIPRLQSTRWRFVVTHNKVAQAVEREGACWTTRKGATFVGRPQATADVDINPIENTLAASALMELVNVSNEDTRPGNVLIVALAAPRSVSRVATRVFKSSIMAARPELSLALVTAPSTILPVPTEAGASLALVTT